MDAATHKAMPMSGLTKQDCMLDLAVLANVMSIHRVPLYWVISKEQEKNAFCRDGFLPTSKPVRDHASVPKILTYFHEIWLWSPLKNLYGKTEFRQNRYSHRHTLRKAVRNIQPVLFYVSSDSHKIRDTRSPSLNILVKIGSGKHVHFLWVKRCDIWNIKNALAKCV
jgi:hypothetical protein